MTESSKDTARACAVALLNRYSFDLGTDNAEQLIAKWLDEYQATWICWAIIEALYQGRYKGVSVKQILACWKRRNQPLYHFNYEFERLVCRNFPGNISPRGNSSTEITLTADMEDVEPLQWSEEIAIAPVPTPNQTTNDSPQNDSLASHGETHSVASSEVHASLQSTARAAAAELLSQLAETPDPEDFLDVKPTAPEPPEKTFVEFINSTKPLQLKRRTAEVPPPKQIAQQVDPLPAKPQQKPVEARPRKMPQTKYQADWSRWDASKQPINRFIPAKESSDFYSKLKAVAQQSEAAPPETAPPESIVPDIDLEKDFWSDD